MINQELITALSKLPPNAKVSFACYCFCDEYEESIPDYYIVEDISFDDQSNTIWLDGDIQ